MLKLNRRWLCLFHLISLSNALPAGIDAAAVVFVPAVSTTTPVSPSLKPRQVAFTQETFTATGYILKFATRSIIASTTVTVRSTTYDVETDSITFTAAAQATSTVSTTTVTKTVTDPARARYATEAPSVEDPAEELGVVAAATAAAGVHSLNVRQATTITTYVSTVEVTQFTTTTSFVTLATVTTTDLELFTSPSTVTETILDTAGLKLVTATETATATAVAEASQSAGGGLSIGAQIGLGVAVGVLALILLALGAWFLIHRRRKRRAAVSSQQSPHTNGDVSTGGQVPGSPWDINSQARPPSELHSQSTGAAPRVWSGQSWSTATAVGGWGEQGNQRESVHGFEQSAHDGQWHPAVHGGSPSMGEHGFMAGGGNGHWHNGHEGHNGVQGPAELLDQPKLHELSEK